MDNGVSRLSPAARKALRLTDPQRIEYIKQMRDDVWIPYTQANRILRRIEELLDDPPTVRPTNLIIYSETNNGKTRILRAAAKRRPKRMNRKGSASRMPVITIEIESPDLHDLYNKVLRELNAVFRERDRVEVKQFQAITVFEKVGTRGLFIDEISAALLGPAWKQKAFFQTLKYLGNQAKIVIVAAGTKEIISALRLARAMNNRFERWELKRWSNDEQFRRLLDAFEYELPLRNASDLQHPKLAEKLHSMCEGYIGELSTILRRAAVLAIKTTSEKIDAKLLDQLDWQGPRERMEFEKLHP